MSALKGVLNKGILLSNSTVGEGVEQITGGDYIIVDNTVPEFPIVSAQIRFIEKIWVDHTEDEGIMVHVKLNDPLVDYLPIEVFSFWEYHTGVPVIPISLNFNNTTKEYEVIIPSVNEVMGFNIIGGHIIGNPMVIEEDLNNYLVDENNNLIVDENDNPIIVEV